MQREHGSEKSRAASRIACAVVVGLALCATPALARHPDGHGKHGHGHVHQGYRPGHGHHGPKHAHPRAVRGFGIHVRLPQTFVVPTRIGRHSVARYEPYFRGQVWFAPHRHRHAVYVFPVRTAAGWVFRPYAYCTGRLLGGQVVYDAPRLHVGVRF